MKSQEHQLTCRSFSGAAADGRFSFPGSTPHYAPDRTFDIQHLKLEVAVDFARYTLSGDCTVTLTAIANRVQTMVFDAVGFKISKITANGRPVRYTYDDRKITLSWPEPIARGKTLDVKISYKVTKPKLGLHFIGPDRQYPSKPVQVWTQGEDEYNRYWFPCHDSPQERMTTEMIATVPAKFTAISNGALLRVSRRGRTRTFHYKHNVPHSPYLVSLVVGEFTELKDKWGKVPVQYFVPPGREDDARRAFGKTPKMIDFFSKKLGVPYPYAKYSQVAAYDFIYGGMENTSATTQTALTLHDERAHMDFSSDPLVAHELAHQWFGDLVTCKDWSHAWLNESFATYFEALFKEHDMGRDEFMNELHDNADAYFDEDHQRYRRPMVTKLYKNTNDLFDRHLYEKGSLILHMIRSLLGDEAWWRSINLYLKRHQTKGVETVDLIQAIQEATGKNMRPFFDQWIFKGGHPEYKVRSWWDPKARSLSVRVLQTHGTNEETGLFSMPVTIGVTVGGKEQRFTETVEKKEHLFTYKLSAEPSLVLFDPDDVILKRVDFSKSETMWTVQLITAQSVIARIVAAEALGSLGGPSAAQTLRRALVEEKFWAVQGAIARALAKAASSIAHDGLLEGLRDISHPKVRRAIFESLASYPSRETLSALRRCYRSEPSYLAQAEAVRAMGRMRDVSLLPVFKELLAMDSWNDVLRCAALDAIGMLQGPESVEILKEYTKYGKHPNARMAAIRRLALLGKGRSDIQQHLLGLLNDSYLLVQMTVVRTLAAFADERAVEPLMALTTGDRDGRLKRTAEETVRKIRKGMEQEFPSPSKTTTKKGG